MASALSQAKKLAAYNNKLEQSNVKLQYSYNKSLADQDRSFQERMANSAHQREIKDLKAAGLNPVLSVTGGNGAATPSGSSTSVSKPNVDMSLPKAVMDMAMAQLNSATQLQMTAMNNANAWQIHTTPGANSPFGQYQAFADYIANTSGISQDTIDAVGSVILGSLGLGGIAKNISSATKTMKNAKNFFKSGKGDTPKGNLGNYKKSTKGKKYDSNAKKHDLNFMVWALENGYDTNSKKTYDKYLKFLSKKKSKR